MGKGESKVELQQYQDLDGGLLRLIGLVLDLWLLVGDTGVKDKVWMKLSLDVVENLLSHLVVATIQGNFLSFFLSAPYS